MGFIGGQAVVSLVTSQVGAATGVKSAHGEQSGLERSRAVLPRKPTASLPLKVRALRPGEGLGFVVHVGFIETP